jgi:hypothetical protein
VSHEKFSVVLPSQCNRLGQGKLRGLRKVGRYQDIAAQDARVGLNSLHEIASLQEPLYAFPQNPTVTPITQRSDADHWRAPSCGGRIASRFRP